MAGAHDRLLNGQVSATFSVEDDAYQMFYYSPIHIIDMKLDFGLHSSKVGVQGTPGEESLSK
ncbi:hypothetical protein TRIUR3_12241 [Triticum urartu]|uniref:Uncharacterized protein n=1 Tax=Triticum urartu TaxID=4572 RepID=M7ZIX7_TRIUA|nr:hypothetical protein TRIUR3_12241 [Triticum urartu]